MKLCVALDLESKKECLELAKSLKGLDIWLKIGMRAFYRDGINFINELKKIENFKIFLDLKLYDIPKTMADTSFELAQIGVDMITLHASSGEAAMSAVIDRLNQAKTRPLVLAVTALTSFDDASFKSIYNENLNKAILHLAKISAKSGLDGVVCSAFESAQIKQAISNEFITLCPGIRPFGESKNDQKRVASLELAKEQKADFIVIGRPIYQAKEPQNIIKQILKNI